MFSGELSANQMISTQGVRFNHRFTLTSQSYVGHQYLKHCSANLNPVEGYIATTEVMPRLGNKEPVFGILRLKNSGEHTVIGEMIYYKTITYNP